MSNELKVSFYLKRSEVKSDGTIPITGRITVGKSMAQFSARCSVQVSLWDTQSGRATGKNKTATELNQALEKINFSIHPHYKELLAKKEKTAAAEVKNAFQGIASEQETLISSCDKYENLFSLRVGVTITLESYKRYGISFNHLKRFLRKKYNVADIPFHLLDYSFIESYDFYLRTQLKFKPNTIINIIGHLKKIVKRAIDQGTLLRNPFADYIPEQPPKKCRHMTAEELDKFMSTPIASKSLCHTRDMFVFGTFTGIGYADLCNLSTEHISKSSNGTMWIHTTRQKTGTECHV